MFKYHTRSPLSLSHSLLVTPLDKLSVSSHWAPLFAWTLSSRFHRRLCFFTVGAVDFGNDLFWPPSSIAWEWTIENRRKYTHICKWHQVWFKFVSNYGPLSQMSSSFQILSGSFLLGRLRITDSENMTWNRSCGSLVAERFVAHWIKPCLIPAENIHAVLHCPLTCLPLWGWAL